MANNKRNDAEVLEYFNGLRQARRGAMMKSYGNYMKSTGGAQTMMKADGLNMMNATSGEGECAAGDGGCLSRKRRRKQKRRNKRRRRG